MSDANLAEQAEELEVLASIYPEEFKSLGDGQFKILLKPNPDGNDNHVIVSLVCEVPPTYPSDSPPSFKIIIEKGLSANQADEVKEVADRVALENIGAPSVFAVAEAVKEWLVDNNIAGQDGSMYSEMMRRMQQKDMQQKKQTEKQAIKALADSEFQDESVDPAELERIRKRQEGTPVTVESFNKWKKEFEEEMALKELEALRATGGNAHNALNPLAAITVTSGSNADEGLGSAANLALLMEQFLAGDGRPTGKQYFLLNMGAGKNTGEGVEDPDAEDGPDGVSEAMEGDYVPSMEDLEDCDEDDEDDEDYVDEGEEDCSDDDED
uniref:RWD domain-containing protein n=1 Tax=Spumella elongata TaxID=89044 RepID=A0A7S3GN04_9STRA